MEDEGRPLPHGWIRQHDPKTHHQFFVDTNVEPPRSIWHHPYDDKTYMSSLSPEERAKIQGLHRVPTNHDIIAAYSDDEQDHHDIPHELPPRPTNQPSKGIHRFGRRMKDKITNTTHEEREKMRAERAKAEQEAYERHQMYRQAMSRAMETGEPQLIGKDKEGKDVYIEPPYQGGYPGQGYGGGYGQNGYGYNPYTQGPYANPNARFLRPVDEYSRPYYGGYGGGLGLPIGLGLGGGLLAGSLLGGELMTCCRFWERDANMLCRCFLLDRVIGISLMKAL
jgi:hypothetical protein